jgi:DNA-binding IclR family transcriptional regulator
MIRSVTWNAAAEPRSTPLERGIQVLQAFRPAGGSLRLSELARRTGLPKSTVHRLVEQMVEMSLLERNGPGLCLGLALFELGELVPVKMRLREVALPYMQDLYEATHETVHLGIRDGLDVVYAEKIRGHSSPDLPSRVGGRLPLTATGVGKTLLAFGDDELREEVLRRPLRGLTEFSITDPDVLREELAQIRATGVGHDRQEAAVGVGCVASPVLVGGEVVAALSITVPAAHWQPARLAPAVRTAGLALSRALGR